MVNSEAAKKTSKGLIRSVAIRSVQLERPPEDGAPEQIGRGNATRQRILDAARTAFAEHGYLETTIDNIITRCQVSRGTFYYYFQNKDDTFEQLVRHAIGEMHKHRTARIASRDRYLRIEAVNRNYLLAWIEHRDVLRNLKQAVSIERRFAVLEDELRMAYVAAVRDSLARQVEAGECRDLDPTVVAHALGCMVGGFAHQWLGLGVVAVSEDETERVIQQISELWYHALYGGRPHAGGVDGVAALI